MFDYDIVVQANILKPRGVHLEMRQWYVQEGASRVKPDEPTHGTPLQAQGWGKRCPPANHRPTREFEQEAIDVQVCFPMSLVRPNVNRWVIWAGAMKV